MAKWTGLERHITLEAAEAEPRANRLFSGQAPNPSPATAEALAQAELARSSQVVNDAAGMIARLKARQPAPSTAGEAESTGETA